MLSLLLSLLYLIGFIYLCFVAFTAFKHKSVIASFVVLQLIIFGYTFFFAPHLIERYALSGYRLAHGGGLNLISYMFLHASIPHILLNSAALLFFGYNMEKEFGAAQTLTVYFLSGLLAGGFFVLFAPYRELVVGASGAIFGLMAYLTLIRPFKITPMPFIVPMPVAVASVLYIIFMAPVIFGSGIAEGVAHIAHFGGMIGGGLMAFAINRQQALKGLAIVIVLGALAYVLPFFF